MIMIDGMGYPTNLNIYESIQYICRPLYTSI